MTFRQAICLSRSSNRGDGVQAGEDLVTLHCFAWPRIAADDVQTGMLVLRHRERCPNGESCTGRLASCGHGHGEEAGGGREVGGGGGRAGAHAAGADPSRFTPLPRAPSPDSAASRRRGGITFTMSRKLLFRLLRGALCGLRWIASHSAGALAPSGEPCAAVQARCPSLARGPGERQRVAVGSSSSLILMTAESRQYYNSRTPAHDRHVGALSIEP